MTAAAPEMAQAARDLLYAFGVGLGFLATVRRDGGPRVHPMCPVLEDGGLFAFIVPSPKRDDLLRDGRIALHSFPMDENEDAVYLTGRAELREDTELRQRLRDTYWKERQAEAPPGFADEALFELLIDTCMITRTTGHGDPMPEHTVWHADG